MNETLIQIIFGWPFIALSLFISVMGNIYNRAWLALIGALLIIPFSYYLNGTPNFSGFALLLPLFQAGAAWAVKEENETWSWLLLAPTVAVILWLILVAIIAQNQ
jgi:peptidoglycan/LPS O-acetylase OafA/YrhL